MKIELIKLALPQPSMAISEQVNVLDRPARFDTSKVSVRSPLHCRIGDIFYQIRDILRGRQKKHPF